MSAEAPPLPRCRQDLVIRQVSDDEFVIKQPSRREYFSIGREEHYLLSLLDGVATRETLNESFSAEFGESLSDEDIDGFLELIRGQGLLESPRKKRSSRSSSRSSSGKSSRRSASSRSSTDRSSSSDSDGGNSDGGSKPKSGDSKRSRSSSSSGGSRSSSRKTSKGPTTSGGGAKKEKSTKRKRPLKAGQSLLFLRVPLFDPDRLFNAIEPRIRWVWTRPFLLITLVGMVWAMMISWANRTEMAAAVIDSMRWETLILIGSLILVATALHEFAHGLTCKHFGGEVHEIGALLMFFIPCLYCNVSDAWLIREKWKRLLITAAGGYCDLCLWMAGVFVWRVTVPGSLASFLSLMVVTVCGGRGFMNLNPLLRLDGYYLLSDWLGISNLRSRSKDYWMSHVRWLLWGAERPDRQAAGTILVLYGIFSWIFAIIFLDLVFLQLLKGANAHFGMVGIAFTMLLLAYAMRRVFKGFWGGEFMTMVKTRTTRTAAWCLGIAGTIGLICIFPTRHLATGEFVVHPSTRVEVHAPVAGFIETIHVEEGSRVEPGQILFELRSSDLMTSLATKEAELRESEANLRKLTLGSRPEEVSAQKLKIQRIESWCELGRAEIEQARVKLEQELLVLDQKIAEAQVELDSTREEFKQSEELYRLGALAGIELQAQRTRIAVLQSRVLQAQAEKRGREITGVQSQQNELVRRQQDLADARAQLTLLEAGSRPEEIAAEEARRQRILKELDHLKHDKEKLIVTAPVGGVISTPHLYEKVGQLLAKGVPICTIENGQRSHVEISVAEDDVMGVEAGQAVTLKARAIPFETFGATVERIAPATRQTTPGGELQPSSTVIVYCSLDNESAQLKSGMTGFGRIHRGWRTLGMSIVSTGLKYLRTEFWW